MANSSENKADAKGGDGGGGGGKDRSSSSKSKTNSMPKDGQVMAAILRDMGVTDYEPRVVNQLLEFSYRYVTNVLDDAKAVSAHAGKKALDVDDVRLAVQMCAEQNVTTPPSREILLDLARAKNSTPLPIPKPTCGLRLPPERHCLTACNYRIKFKPRPRPPGFGGGPVKVAGAGGRYGAKSAKMVMPGSGVVPPGLVVGGAKPPVIKMQPQQQAPPSAMPSIQITPQQPVDGSGAAGAAVAGQPMFKISVNPQIVAASAQQQQHQ